MAANQKSAPKSANRSTNRNTNGSSNKRNVTVRQPDPRTNEIKLFIYLAVSIFLLCSNFGWCGVIGDFFSGVFFGLFGTVTYILPFYLFLTAAFLLANGAKKRVIKRVFCVALLIITAAFVFQLIMGFNGMTAKKLYELGSKDKRGGGVLLGGALVLLHKGIGLTGCIIVTVLLGIIGIIIVMDVSLIEAIKNKLDSIAFEEDEDEGEEDFVSESRRRKESKNKVSMKSITVLGDKDDNNTKSKLKKKNKPVKDEEIHELKPIPQDIEFDIPVPKVESRDFFDDKFFEDLDSYGHEENKADTFIQAEVSDISEAQDETVHKKRRTKESQAEVAISTAEVSESIAEAEASGEAVKEYVFPPISLLKGSKGKTGRSNEASVKETAIKLKQTLDTFGVKVTVTDYCCGPSVTRYELQPEMGVKVSKIVGLADDIKLNLAAEDIRIEAPIPGKAAIGIEVPNKENSTVYFRDLLESDEFKSFKPNLAFAVGKDIGGKAVVADIAKMPHLLVAGATGSGKSVCINTLIMSILYKAKPDDVKLIMVDPKQVELSVYNGLPHMLIPVVTDPKKAAGALNWAVVEMTNRYQLFSQYNVRNLQGYNDKVKSVTGSEQGNEELKKLPQIVIIVDELADLMMVAHGEVEDAIVRLSQLARAAGIHLVIATQRPSVDVITGLIKANVPSRIAMKVASGVDSRTILDMNGAEKLLGNGDMLFYPAGYPKPVRVQGAFLSDEEISDVVDFIKNQMGETVYDEKISNEISNASVGSPAKSTAEAEYDDYFADAGRFIIQKEKGSIGMLQRMYKIGFNRAARIMDQLTETGVVGPEEGTKPRTVLMTMEEFENFVENNL